MLVTALGSHFISLDHKTNAFIPICSHMARIYYA